MPQGMLTSLTHTKKKDNLAIKGGLRSFRICSSGQSEEVLGHHLKYLQLLLITAMLLLLVPQGLVPKSDMLLLGSHFIRWYKFLFCNRRKTK